MKLEKREITLNEQDSMQDMFMTERNVLYAYTQALEKTNRKENVHCFCAHLQETAKELLLVKEKIQKLKEESIC